MRVWNDFIKWFLYITTGILIICAVNFEIAGQDMIPVSTLWRILLSGIVTTGITMVLFPEKSNRKSMVLIRCFIHYAALCTVMILFGHWFGWLDYDFGGILMMVVSVACVYLFCFLSYCLIDLKRADEINKKLKEKYREHE